MYYDNLSLVRMVVTIACSRDITRQLVRCDNNTIFTSKSLETVILYIINGPPTVLNIIFYALNSLTGLSFIFYSLFLA